MKPIQEAGAELANLIMQYVPAISDFIQENGGVIKNFLVSLVKVSFNMLVTLVKGLPSIVRVIGTLIGAAAGFFVAQKAYQIARDVITIGLLTTIAANTAIGSFGLGAAAGVAGGAAAGVTLTGAAVVGGVAAGLGAGAGLVLADEIATPLEGMVDSITSIEAQGKRREARDENKETAERLDKLNDIQRQQLSDFDRFLQGFMARNIDQMSMTTEGQNRILATVVERLDILTQVTEGTGRTMGEVVDSGNDARRLRDEVGAG